MSVQNAGTAIREARLKAELTQEQLAEGVCSVLSLSRIENGSAGVSPSTFQALMAHAGVIVEAYPIFANRADFDCFYRLKQARFYLDSWQLQLAYDKLEEIENIEWGENKFYYQEWLLLHCRLQFRSGLGDHQQIFDNLIHAIHISRPNFDAFDFRSLLLSIPEIELFTALAQEALYLGNLEMCLAICTQVEAYLMNSPMAFLEKDRLLAEHAVVYSKYLIATKDYEKALEIADYHRHKMVQELVDSPLFELTFLMSISYYHQNDLENAITYFKMAFFSAHSIESCYATQCRNYAHDHLQLDLPAELPDFEDIPLAVFSCKKAIDTSSMPDGTYDFFSPDILTIGGLIRELRTTQGISQTVLCQGLCSKSKLSKIENGTLQPDIILAQTLLQRLGISDLVFTFYGNERESKLQELQSLLVKTRNTQPELRKLYLPEMEALCTPKDTLYLQFILSQKTCLEPDIDAKLNLFHNALELSLPNFDFNHLENYRLSWNELSILNNYYSKYANTNIVQGVFYLYKLCEYTNHTPIDILAKNRFFPITISTFARLLYREKRFSELQSLTSALPTIKSSLYFTGTFYAHYCQALGELKDYSQATLTAYYAYYNMLIMESNSNASIMKNAMYRDFQIDIL